MLDLVSKSQASSEEGDIYILEAHYLCSISFTTNLKDKVSVEDQLHAKDRVGTLASFFASASSVNRITWFLRYSQKFIISPN